MSQRHIGILGGTFDPVHLGHLRAAIELIEQLRLDKLLLIPVGVPPHRGPPTATARQRLAMLRLAARGEPRLQVDDRECRKATVSYSIDTLSELREEYGDQTVLSFCVGADAFLDMHRWHRWQELPDLANIIVMARPGWCLPASLGALEQWRERFASLDQGITTVAADSAVEGHAELGRLRHQSGTRIVFPALTPTEISATDIRQRVEKGQSARFLVADGVWRYVERNGLYQHAEHGLQPAQSTEQGDPLTGEE